MSSFHLKISNSAGQVFPNSLSNDMLIYSAEPSIKNIWLGASNSSNSVQINSNATTISGALLANNYSTLSGLQIIDGNGNLSNVANCTVANLTVTGTITSSSGASITGVGSNVTTSNIWTSNIWSSNASFSNLTVASGGSVTLPAGSVTDTMIVGVSGSKVSGVVPTATSLAVGSILSTSLGGTGVTGTATGTGGVVLSSGPTLTNATLSGTLGLPNASVTDTMLATSGISASKITTGSLNLGTGTITGTHVGDGSSISNIAISKITPVATTGTTYTGTGGLVCSNAPTFTGTVNVTALNATGNITPNTTDTYTLGLSTQKFNNVYSSTVTSGNFTGASTVQLSVTGVGASAINVTSTGVGIGTLTPATKLDVSGTVTATAFSGSGTGITGLNQTNLQAGSFAGTGGIVCSNAPTFNTMSNIGTFSNAGVMFTNQLSNVGGIDASTATVKVGSLNVTTGVTLPAGSIKDAMIDTVTASKISGAVATATSVTGTTPDRIGTSALDIGSATFTTTGQITGTHVGDGSSISNITIAKITPAATAVAGVNTGTGGLVCSNAPTINGPTLTGTITLPASQSIDASGNFNGLGFYAGVNGFQISGTKVIDSSKNITCADVTSSGTIKTSTVKADADLVLNPVANISFQKNNVPLMWLANNALYPENDNVLNLGDSTHKWNNLYTTNINASTSLNYYSTSNHYWWLNSSTGNQNYLSLYLYSGGVYLAPGGTNDNKVSLGANGARFSNLWSANVNATTITGTHVGDGSSISNISIANIQPIATTGTSYTGTGGLVCSNAPTINGPTLTGTITLPASQSIDASGNINGLGFYAGVNGFQISGTKVIDSSKNITCADVTSSGTIKTSTVKADADLILNPVANIGFKKNDVALMWLANSALIPANDNGLDLGDSTHKWTNVYTTNIKASTSLNYYSTSNHYWWLNSPTGTQNYLALFINNNNNVYLAPGGTNDNKVSLGFDGARFSAVWAVNGTIQTSDENEKDSVPLPYGLSELLQISTIKYKWKTQSNLPDDDPQKNYEYFGFCARELDTIFPELVYNEESTVNVCYSEIMPIMVNAIKELNTKVQSLETELSAKNESLQQTILNLTNFINSKYPGEFSM